MARIQPLVTSHKPCSQPWKKEEEENTFDAPNLLSQLNLAYLKHAQNTYISLELGKLNEHKAYLIIECWMSRVTYWYGADGEEQDGRLGPGRLSVYQLFTLVTVAPTGSYGSLPCPAPWERTGRHIMSLEKDQNSKAELQFLLNTYHFHTIMNAWPASWETYM